MPKDFVYLRKGKGVMYKKKCEDGIFLDVETDEPIDVDWAKVRVFGLLNDNSFEDAEVCVGYCEGDFNPNDVDEDCKKCEYYTRNVIAKIKGDFLDEFVESADSPSS